LYQSKIVDVFNDSKLRKVLVATKIIMANGPQALTINEKDLTIQEKLEACQV